MAEYTSNPCTKCGSYIKLNEMVKEIWILDRRHILLKYKKSGARIRKMAEDIWISDTTVHPVFNF